MESTEIICPCIKFEYVHAHNIVLCLKYASTFCLGANVFLLLMLPRSVENTHHFIFNLNLTFNLIYLCPDFVLHLTL